MNKLTFMVLFCRIWNRARQITSACRLKLMQSCSALKHSAYLKMILMPLLILSLMLPAACASPEKKTAPLVAVVVSAHEGLQVMRSGRYEWVPLYSQAPIYQGDKIQTSGIQQALLQFTDGSQMKLNANTVLEMGENKENTIKLVVGEIWRNIGTNTAAASSIDTFAGTMESQGGEFVVEADERTTTLIVINGQATLRNNQGTVKVKSGEQCVTEMAMTASPAIHADITDNVNWIKDIRFNVEVLPEPHFQPEELDGATNRYREMVTQNPENAEANLKMGQALLDRGEINQAEPYIQQAMTLQPQSIETIITMAEVNYFKGDLSGAEQRYLQTIDRGENNAGAFVGLGRVYLCRYQFEDCLQVLAKAAEIDEKNVLAVHLTGVTYFLEGKWELAIDSFQKALQIDPHFVKAYLNLATVYEALGETDSAERQLQYVLEEDPENPIALNLQGVLYAKNGEYLKAVTILEQARKLAKAPQEKEMISQNLGACYENLGKLDEAAGAYEAAVAVNPEDILSRHALGMIYQKTGMVPEAVIELQEAIKLGQNAVFLHIDLARVLWGQHRFKEAEWHALEAARIDPDDPWSHAVLSWISEDQGYESQAQTYRDLAYQKQSARTPKTAADFREAGYLYQFIGNLEDADVNYSKAVKLGLNEFEMYTEMGWIYIEQQDWPAAIEAFSHALKLRPDDYWARNDLALSLRKNGRIEESIDEYQRSIVLNPDDYRAHYNLWEVYYDQGEITEAVKELEIAVNLPMPPRIAPLLWKSLGIAYEQTGNTDKAFSAYQRAVDINPENILSHYLLASLYQAQGKIEAALKEVRIAISLAEAADDTVNLGLAHGLLAEIYESQNDFENAIKEMQLAIQNTVDPAEKAFNLWKLGIFFTKSERDDEGIASFSQAILLDNLNPYYYYSRGLTYTRKGSLSLALSDFTDAKRLAEASSNQELIRMIDSAIMQCQ